MIGKAKPDKDYFETVLKKLKIRSEELLFIDDKSKNIQGAEELGIKTILFETPKQLKEELLKLKVIKSKSL